MNKLKIALLAGGNSSEREIALNGAEQVAESLDKNKYDVWVIDLHNRDWVYTDKEGRKYNLDKNDFSLTIGGKHIAFDFALIIIHGTPGEDGKLQGYLDMMGVPYSSCSQVSSTITFDKISTKRAVAGCGINLAKEIFIHKGDNIDSDRIVESLGLPLFVKPNASGSSYGVTRVTDKNEIENAVKLAFTESNEVLIEEALIGKEIGCGVMITKSGKEYVFPSTELVPKAAFFDTTSKYEVGGAEEITPARVSAEVTEKLRKATLDAYRACRCSGVVRVDFIVSEAGDPYMIEINTIPGMTCGSIVPKQVRAAGMTLGQLFDIIIADSLEK